MLSKRKKKERKIERIILSSDIGNEQFTLIIHMTTINLALTSNVNLSHSPISYACREIVNYTCFEGYVIYHSNARI